jgi:hypothetical protein
MRGAVRGIIMRERANNVRERAYNNTACMSVLSIYTTTSVSILESGVTHAPYCTNDYQYCHATRRKLKLDNCVSSA